MSAGKEWDRRRVGALRIKSLNDLFFFTSLAQWHKRVANYGGGPSSFFWPTASQDDTKKEQKLNFRPAKSIRSS